MIISNAGMRRLGIITLNLWIGYCSSGQQLMEVKFERISAFDGLSNNQVNHIFQDKDGFIWISTLSGLNRYDGYEVKTFYHEEGNQASLKNNTVLWLNYGPEGNIWIKNSEGISVYEPYTETFITPTKYLELLQTDASFISEMADDQEGNFWFVINNRGLVKLSENGKVLQFSSSGDGDVKIASNMITDIVKDSDNNIWIVHSIGVIEVIDPSENKVIRRYGLPGALTSKDRIWYLFVDSDRDIWLFAGDDAFGLFYMNTRNGSFRVLDEKKLTSELVRGIIQHENGELWIGSDHGGITVLNKNSWASKAILNEPDVSKSLVNNNVNTIFKDRAGGIWVGSTKSGVSYHHRGANNFDHFKIGKKDPAYNDMSSFAEDAKGNIWIGTNGKGLLYFDREKNTFTSLKDTKAFKGKIPDIIVSLLYSKDKVLWVGSYLEGLYKYDGDRFVKADVIPERSVGGNSIWELFEDSAGNIWIGTLNRGVYRYDPRIGEVKNYNQRVELNSNYVTCITEDNEGKIWLGTGSGLSVYDPENNSFKTYINSDTSDQYSLSNNSIISLLCDSRKQIWIGTLDGLNRYDDSIDGFINLRERDGLSSNIIMSILEDDRGNLWMSTSHGITKMTVNGNRYDMQTFDLSDGLQGDIFTEDAGLKTTDGQLLFSGQNGFNSFAPEEIMVDATSPNLLFTKLHVSNHRIIPGEQYNNRVLLENPLNETSDIFLDHDENSVSFEFVAISFYQSGKIKYQYRLDGFDDHWINASPETRKASYSNLNYGDYTFRVRSSNDPSIWPEEGVFINLHVSPPFWKTDWAYTSYFVLTMLFLYLTRRKIIRRERIKAKAENERREAERQHQLDLMKIKFFTNISHEFRTPLSLVLTPVERMIKAPENIKIQDLTLIQRNAKRLMNLVNQLLDFRKMEANQHSLHQSTGDFVLFLQDIVDSFSDLSREKEIELKFEPEVKSYFTLFDKDKMEKVMFNLLSNAFKFTLPGGQIVVDFEVLNKKGEGQKVAIMVTDTGIGIHQEKQRLIFNRFFQNEVTESIINNGTGIGLSITKEFVELHSGEIKVESKPNIGSTFTVELPFKEISTDEEVVDKLVRELVSSVESEVVDELPDKIKNMPSVLLVEDNLDFRFYLKDNLKQYYNVFIASNGREAWKLIRQELPDIVISDVMMPLMDGHELCEKIKSDPRTSHIPVILLTAQSSDQHRIEGLESGAIEYISKPFNFEILISSINSALKFQKRVRESNDKIKVEPGRVDIESMDEKLIAKAVAFVEQNMSNSEFSVEDLSHELGYSRGHFYQKILRLTGQTPIDFIRNIRMKRASDLLLKSQLNVSEVAYKVGYNNPKLFSRYFKSQYKMYPSQYRARTEKAQGN